MVSEAIALAGGLVFLYYAYVTHVTNQAKKREVSEKKVKRRNMLNKWDLIPFLEERLRDLYK